MVRRRKTSTVFFRHHGAEKRQVYLHLNPQAIRVQQGNKGSVVDTLGGYFREVMHSADPQHNGLMLPELTIECETGIPYKEELRKLEWIWRHHGDRKEDKSPADTYFMDMTDSGPAPSAGGLSSMAAFLPKAYSAQSVSKRMADFIPSSYKTGGYSNGTERYTSRAYKIEILAFAWDDSVQDPFRIRFNFRCKILRDIFWALEESPKKRQATGRMEDFLPSSTSWGGIGETSSGVPTSSPANSWGNSPLNMGAQVSMVQQSRSLLPQSQPLVQLDRVLQSALNLSGLGQNQVVQKIQAIAGRSIFNQQQPVYPRGEFSDVSRTNTALDQIIAALPEVLGAQSQTTVQVGTWEAPILQVVNEAIAGLSLTDLRF